MNVQTIKRTPLYPLHKELGARLVNFAGYEMPVQYSLGIKKEHLHVRKKAGLFDISHMGQVNLSGDLAVQMLEKITPSDFQSLSESRQRYSLLTNNNGGIIDDLMITNTGDHFFIVVNASCKKNDIEYMRNQLSTGCILEEVSDHALLALQGPQASTVMQRFCPEATKMDFMTGRQFIINSTKCFINRCGYTGEDGFEISIPSESAITLAKLLLAEDEVEAIGLGARDSLRLEAGLCLYGHDIDETTTPVEANLNWVISKSRIKDSSQYYPGIETIRNQLADGISRLRIGLVSEGKSPLREGMTILNEKEETVGNLSSGGFSPSIEKPIAIGYIDKEYAGIGTKLIVKVRDRIQKVHVIAMPFITHQYYK
ncbi:MAG TPA: glycine cleavage system aminomethyltransferase GcvT [Thiotrichaceae bacterium]|nr:glycine cleavage system aminomethyltransferase GcvT [Thiotrichaceae bacterium]